MSGANGTSGAQARSTAMIAANVARHTVRPLPGVEPLAPHDVVVTLLDGNLSEAFERARALARAHGSARLIAHGASLTSTWPDWVRTEPGLLLTELGAYRADNPFVATDHLRAAYREWIGDVFEKAAPPGAAADVYYASVVGRLFHAAFESQIFAGGIATVHAGARIHLVGEERRVFEELLGLEAPSVRRRATELAFGPVFVAAWTAACAFTIVECVRMRRDARLSFAALDRHAARTNGKPTVWMGLVPDWDRINKHLVDAGALPALQAGERLGVLLLGTLRAGMREEQDLKTLKNREELWVGLGPLRPELDRCVVAQAVQPRTTLAYVRATAAALRGSVSVGARMLRRPAPLRALVRGGLWSVARRAAASATLDVARSILAEHATRELVEQHDFAGRVVAFNAASAAGYTSVEWVLRQAGAITIEHTHGSGGNAFYGAAESAAMIQSVWTKPDGAVFEGTREIIVAGMPQVLRLRRRTPVVPRRILLMTNYVHRDRPYLALPLEPFQDEMLRVPLLLRKALGPDLEFRWRPHPADEDGAVARGHAKVPFVSLSRDRSLAEDLDACDVAFSGQSTALIEAVTSEVPFFVQVTPELANEMAWVPLERRFFRAEEVVAPFVAWVAALRRGDPEADAATARAKVALFGVSAQPRTLHDAIATLPPRRDPQRFAHARMKP